MKNALFLSFMFGLLLTSCKNDDTLPDCGCNSETLLTIPDETLQTPTEDQKKGLLFYKHQQDIDRFYNDEEYKNRFWILRKTEDCNICETYFIVCNESVLGAEYDYLRQENINDTLEVEFTGNVKQLCELRATPVAYGYGEIVITEIKQQ